MAHVNIANAYLAVGDLDKCVTHNARAIELDPDFGMAYNNLAVSYFHKGDKSKAKEAAAKAQEKGYPVHPDFLPSSLDQ